MKQLKPSTLRWRGGRPRPPFFFLLLAAALTSSVFAAPSLSTIYPRGAGLGETVDVEFHGLRMEKPVDVLIYDEGIEFLEFIPSIEKALYRRYDGRDVREVPGRRVVARLRVAPDARLGEHHMRLVTEQGATDLRTFWIGAFPSLLEHEYYKKRNDEPEGAIIISNMPVTVNGVLFRNDIDAFRISGKKGKRLGAEVECLRLGNHNRSGINDVGLTLKDATGKIVAENSDSDIFLADPVLEFKFPADGEYYLSIAGEVAGYDSQPAYYRLHLGDFQRSVPYPAGGPALAADPTLPTRPPYRVSDTPNLLEAEPNEEPGTASAGSFPAALNGRLERAGDVDVFRLTFGPEHAGKWNVRLHGQSLNSTIDGEMIWHSYDAKKDRWKSSTRGTDSRNASLGLVRLDNRIRDLLDPTMSVNIPKNGGDFAVMVKDAHGRGGDNFIYRVEFERPSQGVILHIPTYGNDSSLQMRNRIQLAQDNASPSWVSAKSEYGSSFKGDLRLVAKGLPDGVVMEAPILAQGMERVPVVFRADKDVPIGGYLVEILAEPVTPTEGFTSRFQQVNNFHSRQNGNCLVHTVVDKLTLAITRPAPFRVEVDQPDAALIQNGEFKIPFAVFRDDDFEGNVEVTMEWIPANVSKSTPVRIKAGETEGVFVMSANSRAEAGSYEVLLTALAGDPRAMRYGGGDHVIASDLFQIQIGKPYITARLARAAVEQGKESTVTAKLEHLRPLKGKTRVTLKGLPRGIELLEEFVEVTADTKEISFKIKADPKALFGMNRGLYCIFEIDEKGERLKQKSGYGYLRIDPERKKVSAR